MAPSKKKLTEIALAKDKLFFPINWLQKQDYCEYQIYLEHVRGIKVKPTPAMVEGHDEHQSLYTRFVEQAVPATPEEMLVESRTANILSREFRVKDLTHGVHGYIDEVWLTPEAFIVIDDKPGDRAYLSTIHQVFGYCLAFKNILQAGDSRKIIAALRTRGTDNLFWQAPFDQNAEEEICTIIQHIHDLLCGKAQFKPTNNPSKCRSCRLSRYCDRTA